MELLNYRTIYKDVKNGKWDRKCALFINKTSFFLDVKLALVSWIANSPIILSPSDLPKKIYKIKQDLKKTEIRKYRCDRCRKEFNQLINFGFFIKKTKTEKNNWVSQNCQNCPKKSKLIEICQSNYQWKNIPFSPQNEKMDLDDLQRTIIYVLKENEPFLKKFTSGVYSVDSDEFVSDKCGFWNNYTVAKWVFFIMLKTPQVDICKLLDISINTNKRWKKKYLSVLKKVKNLFWDRTYW